ncbi:four helix bundle protein [Thiobaca trueperi]|uniref:23S rRNA-intervening sequence protein n=1 Tax=Thiobaca trueperi TaxID=127458 RepID=A0A4R3MU35_9GAMM|nr:four helix bundle protein [Thiobaca trueperi]TCT19844.1 23S rRNA-intervening sequence protein [Thiobaca trueperi]
MARYRHLPIWKAALELAVHLEQAVRSFPRYHKYTLGSELRQTAQRLCRLVARANDARETRALVLDDLVLTVEEMKTLLTLAKEVGAFAQFNDFAWNVNFNNGNTNANNHDNDNHVRLVRGGA